MGTTGIIELGGASAQVFFSPLSPLRTFNNCQMISEPLVSITGVLQVTFVSNEPLPPEFSRTLKFGNVTYNLYSHSFLHFGQVNIFYITSVSFGRIIFIFFIAIKCFQAVNLVKHPLLPFFMNQYVWLLSFIIFKYATDG